MIAFLAASALAAPHLEVAGQLGQLHNGDPDYDLFSENDGIPSRGLRVGGDLGGPVALLVGWQHAGRGMDLTAGDTTLRAAFLSDEVTLGARVGPRFAYFQPFARVDVVLLHASVRLDEQPDDADNVNQLATGAFAPGFEGMLGLEVHSKATRRFPLQPFVDLAAGYAYVAPLAFAELGDVQPKGFVLQGALGLRI